MLLLYFSLSSDLVLRGNAWIYEIRFTLEIALHLNDIIQSSAVITRSSMIRYYMNDCRSSGRISITCWFHKRHPIHRPNGWAMGCLLWILLILHNFRWFGSFLDCIQSLWNLNVTCIAPFSLKIQSNLHIQKICSSMFCWFHWVCLTMTHILQDILAVLHRLMCLKSCFDSLKSCPIQVNVSQSCFHSLNNYSSLIILSMSGG